MTTITPSATVPTTRRASAREPGESTRSAARMPTNADAQRTTVASAAASARPRSLDGIERTAGAGVTAQAYPLHPSAMTELSGLYGSHDGQRADRYERGCSG